MQRRIGMRVDPFVDVVDTALERTEEIRQLGSNLGVLPEKVDCSLQRRRQKLVEVPLKEGRNLLYLTLPSRNPQSVGAQVDLIRIEGTRLR